jgi:hypothetical protein
MNILYLYPLYTHTCGRTFFFLCLYLVSVACLFYIGHVIRLTPYLYITREAPHYAKTYAIVYIIPFDLQI